jgi:flagellar assembly protein FliH
MGAGLDKSLLIRTGEIEPERLKVFEHGDLRGEAGSRGAYIDPAEVLAQARAEAEVKVREAYEEGLRRGEEAGRQQFAETVAQCEEALRQVASQIQETRLNHLTALEPQMVRLAGAIAAQILRREATVDPGIVATAVRAALENLLDRERLTIRLNPADHAVLRERGIDVLDGIDGVREVSVVAQDGIAPGGCVIESETLRIDAQLDAQLGTIFEALLE